MIVTIEETDRLEGSIQAPSSKSYTQRAIITGTLGLGRTRIMSPLNCDDTDVTLRACRLLGARISNGTGQLTIAGPVKQAPQVAIDCGESGSTIRFLTPVAALAKGRTVLTGGVGLLKRPIGALVDTLRQLGVACTSTDGYPPVTVEGGAIRGGRASLVGDVSSQFITGLLLACPLAEEETKITVTTPLESKPYIHLTLGILKRHGIVVEASRSLRRFVIPAKQRYTAVDHIVPGDYSSAAFLMAAAALTNSSITVTNLIPNHPDSDIVNLMRRMGAKVEVRGEEIHLGGGTLKGIEVDARDIPDLIPVIAALGCRAWGSTRILKAGRLRLKESDRLSSITEEFRKFGAQVSEDKERLTINGPSTLKGVKINPHNDHRIAMACAVLGLIAQGTTQIAGAECVTKSYPGFFEDLHNLGGKVYIE